MYVLASSWDLDLGSSRADTDSRRSGLKDRNRLEDLETWLSRRWPLVLLRRSLPDSTYKSLTFSSDTAAVAYYIKKNSWKNIWWMIRLVIDISRKKKSNIFWQNIVKDMSGKNVIDKRKFAKKSTITFLNKNRDKYFTKKILNNISWQKT